MELSYVSSLKLLFPNVMFKPILALQAALESAASEINPALTIHTE